jgi:integrase
MPRRNQGARLRFIEKRQCYYIVWTDSGRSRERSTGTADRASAEQALADFFHENSRKNSASTGSAPKAPDQVLVTDILDDYAREHGPSTAAPRRIGYAIRSLVAYWQGKTVSQVTRNSCREYGTQRARAPGTVRRELSVLSAAVHHSNREGRLAYTVSVFLPERVEGRERWLTRAEARKLYHAALRVARKYPRWWWLPLYVLISLYTGQRKGAVLSLRWPQIDLVKALVNFATPGTRRTNKRRALQPIAMKLLRRLRVAHAHAALQARAELGEAHPTGYVIHENGVGLNDAKNALAAACKLAGLADVTPHTLRHTCCTWLMQEGVPIWEAAGFVGMSQATMEKVYGHHHPDFMTNAVRALNGPGRPPSVP